MKLLILKVLLALCDSVLLFAALWLLSAPVVQFAVAHDWIDDSTGENILYTLRR